MSSDGSPSTVDSVTACRSVPERDRKRTVDATITAFVGTLASQSPW